MKTTDLKDIQIPDHVRELLDPISEDAPTGSESSTDEEYFRLEMEMGKPSPNYKEAIDLATSILQGKSKDLRVASWLCFAWYRYDKIPGLKNGLLLLLELLGAFKDKLYPENPDYRVKAFKILNSSRLVKMLEKEPLDEAVAPTMFETNLILDQLQALSAKQYSENAPDFKALSKIISSQAETAQKMFEETTKEPEKIEEEREEDAPPKKDDVKTPSKEEKPLPEPPKPTKAPPAEAKAAASESQSFSDSEARSTIKKVLSSTMKLENADERKYQAHLFGISRSLIWSNLVIPPHTDSVTELDSPDSEIKTTLDTWYTNQEWQKLIPAVELNLLNEDSPFKYWLTAQRYVAEALANSGGPAIKAAEEVRFQLVKLIHRLPKLENLRFNDNMPFADDQTLDWLNEKVKTIDEGGQNPEMTLPPILGEDYDPINKEYEEACATLSTKFEENLVKMEKGIAADTRRKGKFLRTLNLANLCVQAKEYDLARIHLANLLEKIEDYQLAEWEPALCTSVWESAYLVNLKFLSKEKDAQKRDFLIKQQEELFAKIGNTNGLLALELARRNK
jgi:type VI secretion system protein VasJ